MDSFNMDDLLNPTILKQRLMSIRWDQEQVKEWVSTHQLNLVIMVLILIMGYKSMNSRWEAAKKAGADRASLPAPQFPEIKTLEKFSWKDEKPFILRPFKPTYHLTMALQNLEPSELILMDQNYAQRIAYRSKIIKDSGHIAIGVNDEQKAGPAVRELYDFLLGTYVTKRYPKMFKLHFAQFETGNQVMLENLVTKEVVPATSNRNSDTRRLLSTLGRTLDEDFLLLLEESDSDDPKYVLQACDVVCPSGWDPRQKLGKRLAAIHDPVPSYKDKLEASMDRYFKNLPVGKYVKRANWSIVLTDDLFLPDADTNHAHEGDVVEEVKEINPEKVYLRCERQTLHRLPKSKAIVFAFKTYLTSLKEVKDEGMGNELADAIDGMRTGSAPGVHFYKRAVSWGEAAKRYLRS